MNALYTPFIVSLFTQQYKDHGHVYYEKAHRQKITTEEIVKIAVVAFASAGLALLFIN